MKSNGTEMVKDITFALEKTKDRDVTLNMKNCAI